MGGMAIYSVRYIDCMGYVEMEQQTGDLRYVPLTQLPSPRISRRRGEGEGRIPGRSLFICNLLYWSCYFHDSTLAGQLVFPPHCLVISGKKGKDRRKERGGMEESISKRKRRTPIASRPFVRASPAWVTARNSKTASPYLLLGLAFLEKTPNPKNSLSSLASVQPPPRPYVLLPFYHYSKAPLGRLLLSSVRVSPRSRSFFGVRLVPHLSNG